MTGRPPLPPFTRETAYRRYAWPKMAGIMAPFAFLAYTMIATGVTARNFR